MTCAPAGQLFVWTDIDPAHEDDFNQWYDREHMQERVRIPGMAWARRYRARGAGRRYLAIYRTDSLATFRADAYRAAFGQQTDWSVRNFARMTNTQRRVMAVVQETGFGAGGCLLLAELAQDADLKAAGAALAALSGQQGILRTQLLVPDADLSTPLPSETADPRILCPVVLIDIAATDVPDTVPAHLRAVLGTQTVHSLDLLMSLDAADLAALDCAAPA